MLFCVTTTVQRYKMRDTINETKNSTISRRFLNKELPILAKTVPMLSQRRGFNSIETKKSFGRLTLRDMGKDIDRR